MEDTADDDDFSIESDDSSEAETSEDEDISEVEEDRHSETRMETHQTRYYIEDPSLRQVTDLPGALVLCFVVMAPNERVEKSRTYVLIESDMEDEEAILPDELPASTEDLIRPPENSVVT